MKQLTALVVLVLFVASAIVLVTAQSTTAQAPATTAPGQAMSPAPDPVSTALKNGFDTVTRNLSESAVKMPEENFSFKATPEVMSFGEFLGHVANSHYSYCSRAKGEKNPNTQALEKIAVKADLVKAFNESVDYCKAVYASMTDAKLSTQQVTDAKGQPVLLNGRPMVVFPILLQNLTHDWEHYGNIVTYLRLKGLVPPSTERAQRGRGRGGE